MLQVAFVGTFAASLERPVRDHLSTPCEIVVADETDILPQLQRIDVNVARAEIVDEDALFDALSRRLIAGAALDVWYRYPRAAGPAPPATRPFHDLPNVLMTPHVSGWTDGMLDARARLIAENIRRIERQEAPLNLISS